MPKIVNRILILTEEEGNFHPDKRFGLSEVVNTLKNANYDLVEFQVTTAHRSLKANNSFAQEADIENFRFDANFSIDKFDQLWLFGFSNFDNSNPDNPFHDATPFGEVFPLSDNELAVLSKFMQDGGGVFATGDHENLGTNLCGKVPRVRSMRRWDFDYNKVKDSYDNYDESSSDGPPVFGEHAHDTLVEGHNQNFEFDDQSDDMPQVISPTFYYSGSRYIYTSYPHPILCSPKGVINVLPDHMHEGECEVPADLTKNIVFPGFNKPEYPTLSGYQEVPEVIAWCDVQGGHANPLPAGFDKNSIGRFKNTNKVNTLSESFGAVCVYDGHNVNIGRVVVDSTFHHFVNINLTGVKGGGSVSDDSKKVGFSFSSEGQAAYEKIQCYFRNIALYLMPKNLQLQSFVKLLWYAKFDSQLKMLTPSRGILHTKNYKHWMYYGKSVFEVIQRLYLRCMSLHITIAAIDPLAILCPHYFDVIHLPDPPPPIDWTFIDRGEFLYIALAKIMVDLKANSVGLNREDEEKGVATINALMLKSRNESLNLLSGLYKERYERTLEYMAFAAKHYAGAKLSGGKKAKGG